MGPGDKAASPVPAEASRSEAGEPGDLLLPPSVSGLAPHILAAGLKPPPPQPPNKFQQLKRTVARRLGSLDPAWLRRCQGTPGDEGTMLDAAREQREVGRTPTEEKEEDGDGRGASVGDSGRKRPRGDGGGGRGDGGDGAVAPTKLKRCRRGSAEGAFGADGGLKQSQEEEEKEEEQVAARKESGKTSDPSENLLGELEEEERPRATRRAAVAR